MAKPCPKCGHDLIEWTEPTMLALPPDWWEPGTPYYPTDQEVTTQLCARCGYKREKVK